jgi:enoyl-CoA hydratase
MSKKNAINTYDQGKVRYITLNRPEKLNTLTIEMLDQLYCELERADNAPKINCIVITGEGGKAFSAGADIDYLQNLSEAEAFSFSMKGQKTFQKITKMTKMVIAAVDGFALGGGCELAFSCDFVLASEKSKFGQPEINLGLIPGWGGTQLLKALIGVRKAKELLATGRIFSAEEAERMGLINHIYPSETFQNDVEVYVKTFSRGPQKALRALKKLVKNNLTSSEDFLEESKEFGRLFNSKDLKEGINAFKEKRKPFFTGE